MTIGTTDGNAQTTNYAYDARGQMTSVTDPMGQTTQYTYTIGGNLMLVKYPDGQQNYYQYDELGRRTLLQKASGSQTTNTYDVRGNVTQVMTGKSEAIRFEYNNDDLITKWSGPDFSTSYTYDRVGRRLTMTDAHGTTAYSYQPDNGFLSTLTYPDGTSIRYTYNTQSRTGYTVTSSSGEETNVTAALDRMTFDYTPNSLIKSQPSANGLSTSFQYKGNDLTGMAVSQSGTPLQQFGYEWDGSKNITSITNNSTTDTFGYDALNRVGTETQGDESRGYSYDANGNRASMGSGKLFGLKNAEYTYDSLSRLTKAAGEGIEVGYSYNGDGLLYERTSAGKTTRYYYDEEAKLIAEAEVAGGMPKMTYVYIYDLSGRIWARKDLATDQLQYFHLNGHGDVVGLSDSSGKTLNQYSYDIWGGPLTAEETVPNVLRYAGEYWDDTTGLQYLRARWYDPSMGRFMGEDTYQGEIANPLTMNWYTYVHNNPLKYTDPTGHWISSDQFLSAADQAKIKQATKEFEVAQKKRNKAGMQAAHNKALAIRWASGEYEVIKETNYSTGSSSIYDANVGGVYEDHTWTGVAFDTVASGGVGLGGKLISRGGSSLIKNGTGEAIQKSGPLKLDLQLFAGGKFPTGSVSGKDIVKFLKKEGFNVVSQKGSHVKLQGADGQIVIVPVHGSKDLPIGTLNSIKKQAGYK